MKSVPHALYTVVRRLLTVIISVALSAAALTAVGTARAAAGVVCSADDDVCVTTPDTVQTPVGRITVTVDAGNIVTVHLDPNSVHTLVIGIPFSVPALPSTVPGYNRTTLNTAEGVVTIDSIQLPPGFPVRFTATNLAVISLLPPGPPCRARTTGTTVTFTPVGSGPS